MKRALLLVSVGFALAACDSNVKFNAEGFKCDPGNVCPDGLTCVNGLCQSSTSTGGGAGGGGGGTITDGGDLCAGVVCNSPPFANSCPDQNTLRVYASTGTCNPANGQCDYPYTDSACTSGCTNGTCPGSPCATVTCNTPPADTCQDANTVKKFFQNGTCNSTNGQCSYGSTTVSCAGGCLNGVCISAGLSWSQPMPRVHSPITGIDQAPNSTGDHVLAVGPNGYVAKWNGTSWSTLSSNTTKNLNAVWLFNTTNGVNGWVVGDQGTLLRYDGTALTPVTVSGLTANLVSVHGTNGDTVIAGGGSQVIVRSAGSWALATYPISATNPPPSIVTSVYVEPNGTTTKLRIAGKCGTTAVNTGPCVAQFSPGQTQAQYVDRDTSPPSGVSQYDAIGPDSDGANITSSFVAYGKSTRKYDSNAGSYSNTATFSVGSGAGISQIVAAVSGNTVAGSLYALSPPNSSVNGAVYRVSAGTSPAATSVLPLYGSSASMSRNESGGVVVADNYAKASNIGRRGVTVDEYYEFGEDWIGVERASAGYVLFNAYGEVARRDPSTAASYEFIRNPSAQSPLFEAAAGVGPALMVGQGGNVLRFAGGTCTSCLSPLTNASTRALHSVCRVSDTQWYAVGDNGTVLDISGTSFGALSVTPMTNNGGSANLYDVACEGGMAVAVGDNGTVLKLSGSAWAPLSALPSSPNLRSVAVVGSAIYVAGDSAFLKFENNSWTALPTQSGLRGLFGRSATDVYGYSGAQVYRFNGVSWTSVLTASSTLTTGSSGSSSIVYAGKDGVVAEGQ